jgi:hypothetical protein
LFEARCRNTRGRAGVTEADLLQYGILEEVHLCTASSFVADAYHLHRAGHISNHLWNLCERGISKH